MECLWRRIEVVAIQLYCKLAAMVAVDGYIPATTDAEVSALWHDLDEATSLFVVLLFHLVSDATEYLARLVGGVVVDHDDVKLEVGFLAEGTLHGISDGLLSIEDWDDHGSLVLKVLLVEVGQAIITSIYQCSHLLQVLGTSTLHLYLNLTVARVHVVELLLATLSRVEFILCIKIFVEVEDFTHTAQVEAKVVETRIEIIYSIGLGGIVTKAL